MRSVLPRSAAGAALVIGAVLGPGALANIGAGLGPGVRSGEHVVWTPEPVAHLRAVLGREISDRARAVEIAQVVHSESSRVQLDPLYVLALMKVESGFRADAVSPRGAIGLLQVRPIAARAVLGAAGSTQVARAVRLEDPRTNVALGLQYLRNLEGQFSDRSTALAAYNMGPTRVRRQIRARRPVPRGYARRVLGAYERYKSRGTG